jgi:hypothetical protein
LSPVEHTIIGNETGGTSRYTKHQLGRGEHARAGEAGKPARNPNKILGSRLLVPPNSIMPELYLHKRRVDSVFSLLGQNENDITFSIGWALSRSPTFLKNLLRKILHDRHRSDSEQIVVSLQDFRKQAGITDIEIRDPNLHLILEAKRGWALPSVQQLTGYLPRFDETKAKERLIVTMSECSNSYAREFLPAKLNRIDIRHISWSEVSSLSHLRRGTHAEKRLMRELRDYLATIVNMQSQESNWVYVVSLSDWEWAPNLSFIKIVEERRRYFHPYGKGGWPKEPPNYLGFRYWGRLQSIHHVESSEVIRNFHTHFPEYPNKEEGPHFLYKLGPAIRPMREVKTGNIFRNGRVWAMLDLLLTSKTISAARTASYKRVEEI